MHSYISTITFMGQVSGESVTGRLQDLPTGDRGALDQLMPAVYKELRRTAHAYMRSEQGNTLQTTALVNEAWLRMVEIRKIDWQDRSHFFALAAKVMRRILVDRARTNAALKRGAGSRGMQLDAQIAIAPGWQAELLDLDLALDALAALDARKARVVELRFFGGMSVEETAQALDISAKTVLRDWSIARTWLARQMNSGLATPASDG